jgi:hypothetical protein
MMITCSRCKTDKPETAFGKHAWCRECLKAYNAEPERKRRRADLAKASYQANPEAWNIRKRKHRATINGRSLQLLDNARLRAERLGLPFDLSRDWIAERLGGKCALTGRSFDLSRPSDGVRANPGAPSLDRKENSKGYTKDNVRLVTVHANVARNEFSDTDLLTLAHDIIRTISSQASQEEGSTTIPQGSRDQAVPKRAAPAKTGDDIVSPLP